MVYSYFYKVSIEKTVEFKAVERLPAKGSGSCGRVLLVVAWSIPASQSGTIGLVKPKHVSWPPAFSWALQFLPNIFLAFVNIIKTMKVLITRG